MTYSFIHRRSAHRLDKFRKLTVISGRKQGLSPILDVCTRWRSTYDMIDRALQCKETYCSVLLDDELTDFLLEEVEWRGLGSLRDLLQKFDALTTKACASKSYTTISLTIVIYNKLMDTIEDYIEKNEDRLPEICRGAKAAQEKLKKYYSATDKSPIYSVVTALHPAMRYHYWSNQEWGSELEDAAKDAVRSVWNRDYSMETEDHDDDHEDLTLPLLDPDDNSELALLGFTGRRKEGDELEGFAASPTVKELPLSFWKRSCDSYPRLARMARDYFAIPATSAPSERSFSKGRALLPYNRSRLGPQKVKEQLALDSWYEYFSKK